MPALKKTQQDKMTFDEFMAWNDTQEGRWELHDGVPVRRHDPARGHSERLQHIRTKHRIVRALEDALDQKQLNCEALADGATVRISDGVSDGEISYEPDALVYCGERADGNDLVAPNPVIIVEVLSPSTAYKDISDKLLDYFKLPSVVHYLILDPKNNLMTHHYRDGTQISQKAVNEDRLKLDPPGIMVEMSKVFG